MKKYQIFEILLRLLSLCLGVVGALWVGGRLQLRRNKNISFYIVPSPLRGMFSTKISGGIINIAHLIKIESDLNRICLPISTEYFRSALRIHGLPHHLQPICLPRFCLRFLLSVSKGRLIIHIPEFLMDSEWVSLASQNENITLNVLNQNSVLFDVALAERSGLQGELNLQRKLSITCAHESYLDKTKKLFPKAHCFLLGVWVHHSSYIRLNWIQKKNIILLSPDDMKWNLAFTEAVKDAGAPFECKIIHDMKYSEYLSLLENCKFMITTGEGMDGYFVETFFCGGIAFAKWNADFFPEHYPADVVNLSHSFDINELIQQIIHLDRNEVDRRMIVQKNLNSLNETYNKDLKLSLAEFYSSLSSWMEKTG